MKKILLSILLLLLVFYHIFPQALSPLRGSSFIFTSGLIGLALYFNNNFPYGGLTPIVKAYLPFTLWAILAGVVAEYFQDNYLSNYTRSQVAWIFSAYLISYVFFKAYPRGTFIQFLYFVVGAILLQAVISLIMSQNESVRNFFFSLQMTDLVDQIKREDTEGQRLLGYGIAFFGAGIVYGLGLILLVYILMKEKLNLIKTSLLAMVYIIFAYVGLLSARTTTTGIFASLILMILLFFFGGDTKKSQMWSFLAIAALLAVVGYTLTYEYFSSFADWAFEAFINFFEAGEFRTRSSDGLENMFYLPEDTRMWIIGRGGMAFWGSDVGYTRLLFYFGLPGTLAFFFYQFYLMKMSATKDTAFVLTLLVIFAYNLGLNIKGLSDLNLFIYLFVFYFLHYRYFIYSPSAKRGYNATTLRNAIQSPTPRRRL